jgi:hypothetical protein
MAYSREDIKLHKKFKTPLTYLEQEIKYYAPFKIERSLTEFAYYCELGGKKTYAQIVGKATLDELEKKYALQNDMYLDTLKRRKK